MFVKLWKVMCLCWKYVCKNVVYVFVYILLFLKNWILCCVKYVVFVWLMVLKWFFILVVKVIICRSILWFWFVVVVLKIFWVFVIILYVVCLIVLVLKIVSRFVLSMVWSVLRFNGFLLSKVKCFNLNVKLNL